MKDDEAKTDDKARSESLDANLSALEVGRNLNRKIEFFSAKFIFSLLNNTNSLIIAGVTLAVLVRLAESWALITDELVTYGLSWRVTALIFGMIFPAIILGAALLFAFRILRDFFQIETVIQESSDHTEKAVSSLIAELARDKNQFNNEKNRESSDNIDPRIIFLMFRERMLLDGARLSKLSLRNLSIGIAASVIALAFFGYPLVSELFGVKPPISIGAGASEGALPWDWITRYYLPRFGVGIILQFVGFFFLRLYVSNEHDIKYNKNEITNIEAKFLAYAISTRPKVGSSISIINSLIKTERNFVLKRGERVLASVADEQYNDLRSLLESAVKSLPKVPPPKADPGRVSP